MPVKAQKIQEAYSDYICEHGKRPVTVFAFCKNLKIEESQFYEHYASFDGLESSFFESFHENTLTLLEKDKNYGESDAKNKLLAYYYTFFEVAKANRTLMVQILPSDSKSLLKANILKNYKHIFQAYIDGLGIEMSFLDKTPLSSYQYKGIRSAAWLQFLKTLDFWLKDHSKGFEKTDVFIEKSLKASFDLIQNNPFESLLDFGKFLYHETIKK